MTVALLKNVGTHLAVHKAVSLIKEAGPEYMKGKIPCRRGSL